MVTLLCFCCDHRNPAGAKFCNACGAPLHLKPCKHCEAINARAAAHCHQCGETFALEFLSLVEAVQMQDAPDAAPIPAPVEGTAEAPDARPRRGVFTTRIAAVFLGLTATALLSAYYAYQQPGSGFGSAVVIERSQPAGSATAPDLRLEATPTHPSAPTTLQVASPAAPPEQLGISRGEIETVAGAEVNGATRRVATTPHQSSARPRPGAKRGAQASSTKSKAEPGRNIARPIRDEPVATKPPTVGREDEGRPLPDPGPIALQQTVSAPPGRSAAVDPAPVRGPSDSARSPTPASGGWDRPCAEGGALDSGCDVRMMPKGN